MADVSGDAEQAGKSPAASGVARDGSAGTSSTGTSSGSGGSDAIKKPAVQGAAKPAARVTGKATAGGISAAKKPTVQTPTAQEAIQFKITNIRADDSYLKLMVHADYGVGKTKLMASAVEVPQMRDVLLLNAESGDLTIATDPNPDYRLIDRVTIQQYRMLDAIYRFLLTHCVLRDKFLSRNISADEKAKIEAQLWELQHKHFDEDNMEDPDRLRLFKTLVIDSLSEIEELCMGQILGITDRTRMDELTMTAEWTEFKQNYGMIRRLMRNFRNLPMNVLFTCATSFTEDERKRKYWQPLLTGKLSRAVLGFMDMTGYMIQGKAVEGEDDDENKIVAFPRRMYITPSGQWAAKHRFSNFKEPHFDDPSIEKILKAVGLYRATAE